jgi:hypothetical protein
MAYNDFVMKVLEKGTPYLWQLDIRCTGSGNGGKGCKAKLQLDKEDLFSTSSHPYGDSNPTYFVTFQCCECQVLTDLKTEQWPCHWAELPTKDDWIKRRASTDVIEESKK